MTDPRLVDAIVCGGGPAGLAAATWLGRYRRKTLLLDEGNQRNLPARASHGYLAHDGAAPGELIAAAQRDLSRYDAVELKRERALDAHAEDDCFVVTTQDDQYRSARLVLATGVEDVVPDIPEFAQLYGTSIFHCSCCDGFESRDQDLVAIGWSENSAGFALDLLNWGASVTLVTNGETFEGDENARAALARNSITLVEDEVAGIEQVEGRLQGVRLASGRFVAATRAFFSIAHRPRNSLARNLGCELVADGYVKVAEHGETTVDGVYAAGDLVPGEQLVQAAAAQGAIAGIACAMSLRGDDWKSGAPPPGPDPETELSAPRGPAKKKVSE